MGNKLKLFEKQDIIWHAKGYRNLLYVGGIQCGKTTLGAAFSLRAAMLPGDPVWHTEVE